MKHLDLVAVWVFLAGAVFVAGLLTLAVKDYEREEAERLRRVHSDGMVAGSWLCQGGRP